MKKQINGDGPQEIEGKEIGDKERGDTVTGEEEQKRGSEVNRNEGSRSK
jgi:hypothetical protein